jgi:hypothetical protein
MAQDLAFFEVPIPYGERPKGSASKLRTFRDGAKISWTLVRLLKDFRPLPFYLALAGLTLALSLFAPFAAIKDAGQFLAALMIALGFYWDSKLRWHRLRLDHARAREESAPARRAA